MPDVERSRRSWLVLHIGWRDGRHAVPSRSIFIAANAPRARVDVVGEAATTSDTTRPPATRSSIRASHDDRRALSLCTTRSACITSAPIRCPVPVARRKQHVAGCSPRPPMATRCCGARKQVRPVVHAVVDFHQGEQLFGAARRLHARRRANWIGRATFSARVSVGRVE